MKWPQYGGEQKLVIYNIGFYFVLAYQILVNMDTDEDSNLISDKRSS